MTPMLDSSGNIANLRRPHAFQGNIDKVSALILNGERLLVTHNPHPRKSVGRVIVVWLRDWVGTWNNGSPQNGYIIGEALTYQGAENLAAEWATRIGQK